ncbi:FAD-dependent monooxygenase sdcF [Cladobotryum mycophilum]|uniref:FAD-dependent monooxygenase sdcF n=1 Tax=Cladobotryum mycophilum TaxID=491253 RepID=A0ABR0SCC8_9HYPO
MQQNGGNALGLKSKDGPLMLVQLAAKWEQASLDSAVEKGLEELVNEIEKRAKAKGLYRGFVYVNYAGKTQDPLKRYGEESYKRLQAVAKKYDPKGLLNKLWKGYFQVERND